MDFNTFSVKILSASLDGNYSLFVNILEANWSYSPRLREVRQKSSFDNVAHLAAISGSVDILRYLASFCCNERLLKTENLYGKTPLHLSVQFGHLQCVEFLVAYGVPVDALKKGDWTPLMLSCSQKNSDMVKLLLGAGANPRLVNKDGWSSFHIACREGYLDTIICLLSYDSTLWDTKSRNGRTPLHTAALHGKKDTVFLLLMYGDYPPDEADSCGITPFMDAAASNNVPIMDLLIENKAFPYTVDVLGRNSLHIASQAGSLDVITFLVEKCHMEIDKKTPQNETPEDFAVKENHMEAVSLLSSLKNASNTQVRAKSIADLTSAPLKF